ncbi:MAG: redoxin domain-containing protein [Planctomycetota bacterium]|nr:redoxin domain-containing protein [Planctomycetota bacterium]
MAVSTGDLAPSISLAEAPGQTVDVDWSAGPTVILFFPLAFSGVCQEEFCTVRDDWDAWTGLGAKVYGISIDSCFVVAKFRELESLPFPLLSDFNKTTCAEWGTLLEDLMGQKGVSTRAAFVVDTDGKVVHAAIQENPGELPDFAAIKAAVSSAAGATA